jgi:hypothetical protein
MKGGEFKGILVIAGGVMVFTDTGRQDTLVAYEQSILQALTSIGSIQVICCYPRDSLRNLEFSNLISVASAHQCVMDARANYREITYYSLLEAISEGVEGILGADSARLILQTMKMIYGLDENSILSNPGVFEEKLRRVLGNASPTVLDSICDRVRQLL